MSYLDEFFDKRKAQKKLTPEQQEKEREKVLEDQRQKALNFKKFFGAEHGKEVMLDLMNKFYLGTPETESPIVMARAAGRRDVVEYLLNRANVSMEQLDRILKGDFTI